MKKRECDGCFACCVVLAIPELHKARLTVCKNLEDCSGHGKQCGIYADRPETCRGFKCGWLQDESLGSMVDRPDKVGLMVTYQKSDQHDYVTMLVFETHEHASQSIEGQRFISYLTGQVEQLRTTMVVALTDGRCQIYGRPDDIKRIWPEHAHMNKNLNMSDGSEQ